MYLGVCIGVGVCGYSSRIIEDMMIFVFWISFCLRGQVSGSIEWNEICS